MRVPGQQQLVAAMHQHRVLLAQGDQLAVMVEHRLRIGQRRFRVDVGVVVVDGQPGCAAGEAALRLHRPLHGGAGIVAALGVDAAHHPRRNLPALLCGHAVHVAGFDVLVVVDARPGHVGHAQLFALVNIGRALHQVQAGGQHLGRAFAVGRAVVAKARDDARLVVVVPVQAVPALAVQTALPTAQAGFEVGQLQGLERPFAFAALAVQVHVFELEHHVERPGLGVGDVAGFLHGGAGRFAHGDAVVVVQHFTAHFAHEIHEARPMLDHVDGRLEKTVLHHRRVRQGAVGQPGLGDQVDHIHAKAAHAFLEPEVHQVVDLGAHLGVLPVQVGLLGREHVQVVLSGGLIEGPGRTTENRLPVVGLPAIHGLLPDVVIVVRVVARRACLAEPVVFVRGVVDHQVHHERDAALGHACEHGVEIGHGAELAHDGAVVADVVTVVVVGRLVNR